MKRLLLVFTFCFGILFAAPFDSDKWVDTYYQNPTPEKFSEAVRDFSQKRLFHEHAKLPLEAFLAAVMFQNPMQVESWLSELNDLPPNDLDAVYEALFFSGLDRASDLICKYATAKCKPPEYLEVYGNSPPPIYELPLNDPAILDMNWGYFFATGEKRPIRHIIEAFNYVDYYGSAEAYANSAKTEKDKQSAFYDAIFRAALWSVESNCRQHPRVLEHCESIIATESLTQNEQIYLISVLSKIKPYQYHIEMGSE